MTSLIKNQILKHLTKFFKDLVPEQLQLSAFKGSCELNNLQLEEKVLMELLSFPAWIRINKATCDQLTIKIPWTKIKSVPIQMNLNEVTVEVEVCEDFRDISSNESGNSDGADAATSLSGTEQDLNISNLINSQAAPGKYGFVDRVIDGMTVTVNSVLVSFKSKIMAVSLNLSRVLLESRCPNWRPGDLSLSRIKDMDRGLILLFKIVEWQNMRLEAKCLTDPKQTPLRLITNHAQCRLTIKKKLDDCSVVAARIFVIFEDILWVLTFAQFISAASFVEYIFTLIKKSPVSKKSALLDDQNKSSGSFTATSANSSASSFATQSMISPFGASLHPNHSGFGSGERGAPLLTGNMSAAALLEQKFLTYDIAETSLHLYIDKVDAHLYDDIDISPVSKCSRDSGGALQTTLDQIQVDCYPYSRANGSREHWYNWFDPSATSRKQWFNGHFAEFDLMRIRRLETSGCNPFSGNPCDSSTAAYNQSATNEQSRASPRESANNAKFLVEPTATNEQLLSLTVLVRVKDYCMNCVATQHSDRNSILSKFIQTDATCHFHPNMPSFYLELNYFYYFDSLNRMMIYDDVPEPLAFLHLSPTKLLFDPPTLVFLNTFQINLSRALSHLNDLFPDETSAPKIHCRVEILVPQISLPAKPKEKSDKDQQADSNPASPRTQAKGLDPVDTSTLLVKSGKLVLCNSIHDGNLLSKLVKSIEMLKENPCPPINVGDRKASHDSSGDWKKVWNESLIEKIGTASNIWAIQFEPVWMDFLNYDVDGLSSEKRLEPIVEPFNANMFVHLDLSNTLSQKECKSKPKAGTNRDTVSILISVLDGPILANMDKVQFGFLQRLGLHVERLIQQIKEDASSIIQVETVVEDTLEINLTAYIKDIKARLILERKAEKQSVSEPATNPSLPGPKEMGIGACLVPQRARPSGVKPTESPNRSHSERSSTINQPQTPRVGVYASDLSDRGARLPTSGPIEDRIVEAVPAESDVDIGELDECAEAADSALELFSLTSPKLEPANNPAPAAASNNIGDSSAGRDTPGLSPGGAASNAARNLLVNLDEMEQCASLFEKVDLKSATRDEANHPSQQPQPQQPPQQQHPAQQEIETESISYLELSMSQLMVRRITETKRRQKF